MASYTAVNGALLALESFLTSRMPSELSGGDVSATVSLKGSAEIATMSHNTLVLYMHRVEVDPHGRARHFSPQGNGQQDPVRELPVNLHILMLAAASSATIEANLLSWAMIELANHSQLNISHMADSDETWTEREILTVTPAEMSNEDLMRIWDALDQPYTSSVPYVLRTIRLRLNAPDSVGPAVTTRVFPVGRATTKVEGA